MPGKPDGCLDEWGSPLCVSASCGAFSSFLGFRCYCYELANLLLVKEASEGCPLTTWKEYRTVSRVTSKWLAMVKNGWPYWESYCDAVPQPMGLDCEDVHGLPPPPSEGPWHLDGIGSMPMQGK